MRAQTQRLLVRQRSELLGEILVSLAESLALDADFVALDTQIVEPLDHAVLLVVGHVALRCCAQARQQLALHVLEAGKKGIAGDILGVCTLLDNAFAERDARVADAEHLFGDATVQGNFLVWHLSSGLERLAGCEPTSQRW